MVSAGRIPFPSPPRVAFLLLCALVLLGVPACGGDTSGTNSELEALAAKYTYEFPPDLPFDASEWRTNTEYTPIGDPRAVRVKGKAFKIPWTAYPTTLRTHGPNSNSVQTRGMAALIYESMLQIHPETEEFIPCLASHWKVEDHPDGTQTLTFRLDERARWANGDPVEADDVYYSWWHRVQEDRKDPMTRMTYAEDFEEPEVLDRLTIRVKTTEANWRLLLYFGGMAIYPAPYIKIPGEQYLDLYNWRYPMGTGPYEVDYAKMKKGQSFELRRRDDWWAENERWGKGTYNFDRIKYVTLRDRELTYLTFKNGDEDLDWFPVSRASRWVEELPKEQDIANGWIQKRKIYNEHPVGYSGLCFNMREKPFDDIRVRQAVAHLFNREELMEKLFFNEYDYTNSIFPGRDWGSGKDRPRVYFDPTRAAELLAEAGYEKRNDEGILVGPDGQPLEVTLEYGTQAWERIWLRVQESFQAGGVKFNLKLLDPTTLGKKISERQFKIHYQPWGAILFPNPETSWRSDLADQDYNNNIPGFKNDRVDHLCEIYNVAKTWKERKDITREIDTIVCSQYPYAFAWHSNFFRLLYWDKFGHPDTYVTRIGDQIDEQMVLLWWYDKAKIARLEKARKDKTPIPQGEVIVKPWADDGK